MISIRLVYLHSIEKSDLYSFIKKLIQFSQSYRYSELFY
jgi:hypothetical protein